MRAHCKESLPVLVLFIHVISYQVTQPQNFGFFRDQSFIKNALDMFITLEFLKTCYDVMYNSKRWKRLVLTHHNWH